MTVVDNAVYVAGRRYAEPDSLDVTYQRLRECDGMAWIGLYRPDEAEIRSVAQEFGFHELIVEDAIKAHQRPKVERYDDVRFTVLRTARYLDDVEEVEFGELHVFTGKDFVVTIRHAEKPDLARVRRRMESTPDLLRLGPDAVLYALLDEVVDEYAPVAAGLENDIDEIEDQVFDGDPEVSRRIYGLSREVIEFERATQPLLAILRGLSAGFARDGTDAELQRLLRDVADHTERIVEQVGRFRALLQNILSVNATLVAQRQNEEAARMTAASLAQNEEVKRISSWAAILFTPTLVGTVYGMNFVHMPELDWRFGYPFALLLMLLTGLAMRLWFKRRGWL